METLNCVQFVLIQSGGTNGTAARTKVSSRFTLGALHAVLRLPFAHPSLFRRQSAHRTQSHLQLMSRFPATLIDVSL